MAPFPAINFSLFYHFGTSLMILFEPINPYYKRRQDGFSIFRVAVRNLGFYLWICISAKRGEVFRPVPARVEIAGKDRSWPE